MRGEAIWPWGVAELREFRCVSTTDRHLRAHGQAWALYVNDFRVPKYWAYKDGIYFKVFDQQFFQDHQGQSLRFSQNATDFIDTGLKLPGPHSGAQKLKNDLTKLPLQDDVLK